MPTEYIPVYKPGQALTLKASATVTAGQVVAVTGSGTVGPAGAASKAVVGVVAFSGVANDNVTVYAGGVQTCTASGAITAGDPVIAGAAGTVVSAASPAAGTQLGIALTTAADAAAVRVQFAR